jgi:hypothetical protein
LPPEVRFASILYRIAAIYGVIVLIPAYLLALRPPHLDAIGFAGTALVFQGVFWVISRDPLRFKPFVALSVFEKLCFGVPAMVMWSRRMVGDVALFGAIDLVLGVLFAIAWLRLRRVPA